MTTKDLLSERVAVLGYGQEGEAVIRYLLKHGITPVLFDKQDRPETKTLGIEAITGAGYLEQLPQFTIAFRSPGFPRLQPKLVAAERQGTAITSQTKWFFEHTPAKIIGVTGTKGKGTTASLIHHFFNFQGGQKTFLTGNIGQVQPLDFLDDLTGKEVIIYELSSFQLQDLTASPHIAVVLMVTEDHLDVHADVDEYHKAKQNIVIHQKDADFAIINNDYPASRKIGEGTVGHKLFASRRGKVSAGAYVDGAEIIFTGIPGAPEGTVNLSAVPLRGEHNWENVMAAALASMCAGVTVDSMRQALPSFQGLPHRLERLPEQNGVAFYDDSISTVPDTAEAAIKSFTEPLVVILGGSDKHADFSSLARTVAQTPNVKAVALVGQTALAIKAALAAAGYAKTLLDGFNDLRLTLTAVKGVVKPGDVILLSPACASFGWFKDYKDRGQQFARLTQEWDTL
jgi:UDP-N-acetylmuramoylalanine--D-glutamate ligase